MILLSFDTEEFDVPREHGVNFSLEDGMKVSVYGTNKILDILKENRVCATFFCTGNFARHAPEVIERIKREGHEIACHGVDHWCPKTDDVFRSKEIIEQVSGVKVAGYRQPRMFPVSDSDIEKAGFLYNSSLNPACIPGRYIHLTTPRRWFMRGNVMEIPSSVTPWFRIPLFWLALHNFPEWLYHAFVACVLRHDGYFVTYFHPWEFYHLKEHLEFKMPFIIKNHCGDELAGRLDRFIKKFRRNGEDFITFTEFMNKQKSK